MAVIDAWDETQEEKECFERTLQRALGLNEVVVALKPFPPQERPDLSAAVHAESTDIWRRVVRLRQRVRELQTRREEVERRIGATDPKLAARSAEIEAEYERLSTSWNAIEMAVTRLGLDVQTDDLDQALLHIRDRIESATESSLAASLAARPASKYSATIPEQHVPPESAASPGSADTPAGLGARLASIIRAPFGAARDERERVGRAVSGLRKDIVRLEQALQDQASAISELVPEAARRDAEYITITAELNQAWRHLEDGLLNDGILDTVRRVLNDRLETLYTVHMPVIIAPALNDPMGLDRPVETPAIQEVRSLLGRMRGMSIGISGPRGAGKSTLIDAFCNGTTLPADEQRPGKPNRWLGLRVAAPVEYEPRDFILYLFAELCRRVPGVQGDRDLEPDPADSDARSKSSARVFGLAVLLAGVISITAAIVLLARMLHAQPRIIPELSVGLGVVLVLLAVSTAYQYALSPRYWRPSLRRRQWRYHLLPSLLQARLLAFNTVVVGGTLAVLEQRLSPVNPNDYLIGAAGIAASGLIGFGAYNYLPAAPPIPGSSRQRAESDLSSTAVMRRLVVLAAWVAGTLLAFSIAAITLSFVKSGWNIQLLAALAFLVIGYEAFLTLLTPVFSIEFSLAAPMSGGDEDEAEDIAVVARANLLGVLYQKSVSRDSSGTLSFAPARFGVGISSQWSQGASWARQPQNYPELVGRFQDAVASIARRYRIVIGIDELDKIESGVKAEQFLNDIKGIFGQRECYFLVSVSEDAAASFERRGVPFRDVFDTCFDAVVTVDYLDYLSAKQLLYSLVIGWPVPFIALCYVMSGGLARDLKRAARIVKQQSGQELSLNEAARLLCREEATAKTHGLQHQLLRSVDDGLSDGLLALLAQMRNEAVGSGNPGAVYIARSEQLDRWATTAAGAVGEDGDSHIDPPACRWARDLSALYMFLATVLDFFTDEIHRGSLETAEDPGQGTRSLDHLAAGRQAMSVNANIAIRYIQDFRAAWAQGPADSQPAPARANASPLKKLGTTLLRSVTNRDRGR